MAGLNKEAWIADIKEALLRDASFLSTMSDWTAFVNNDVIHLPQAGELGTPGKNTTAVLVPVQRADSDLTIKMDLYNSEAVKVTKLESYQLSYDKRQSVMGHQIRHMLQFAGDSVLQSIAPTLTPKQVTVTGLVTYQSILSAAKILDLDNVPAFDRSLALPTDMYYELLADEDVIRRGFNVAAVEDGKVFRLAGFTIYQRPQVATIGGKQAGVGYQKAGVGQAVGEIDMLINEGAGNGDALYLGSIMTAIMKLGAGKARTDQKGTVALVRA